MEKIFFNRDGVPFLDRGADSVPIPAGITHLHGWYVITQHLESTAGGGARWTLYHRNWTMSAPRDDRFTQFFSIGSFEPTFRGIVKNPLIWWFPHEWDEEVEERKKTALLQKYKKGYNPIVRETGWTANTLKPLPAQALLTRVLFQKIVRKDVVRYHQGHLDIVPLSGDVFVGETDVAVAANTAYGDYRWSRRHLFNHHFIGATMVAALRWGAEDRVWGLVYGHRDGWIVSPDHRDAPCYLGKGLWLVSHPVPQPQAPVD